MKQTVIITGANGGLGSAMAKEFSHSKDGNLDYHCVYTVRQEANSPNLANALNDAKEGYTYDVASLDLSSLAAVRQFAQSINAKIAAGELGPIRALILNAGYQEHTSQHFSDDGFAMSFQCNYLSHWLLTLTLLQNLDPDHGRVVVVGSWSHDAWDKRNDIMKAFDDPKWKMLFVDTDSVAKGTWSPPTDDGAMQAGFRRYGASKLCQIMMIYELQERLDADSRLNKVAVVGVDPGGMATDLTRRGSWAMVFMVQWLFPIISGILTYLSPNGTLRLTSKSARDVLRAAFDTKEFGDSPKAVYMNGSEKGSTSAESKDPEKRAMLWKDSIRYVGLTGADTSLEKWN